MELADDYTDLLDQLEQNGQIKPITEYWARYRGEACNACNKHFRDYFQMPHLPHVYGRDAVGSFRAAHMGMHFRTVTKTINDEFTSIHQYCDEHTLHILIYGNYPEIVIYSIPLILMETDFAE